MFRFEDIGGRMAKIYTSKSELGGTRETVICMASNATREHERDLYTGIQLALLFTPKRHGLVWRRICRERVRERADGPQEAIRERFGRVRYPVF